MLPELIEDLDMCDLRAVVLSCKAYGVAIKPGDTLTIDPKPFSMRITEEGFEILSRLGAVTRRED